MNGRQIISPRSPRFRVKEVSELQSTSYRRSIAVNSWNQYRMANTILENRWKNVSKNIIVWPFQFHLTLSRPRVMFGLSHSFVSIELALFLFPWLAGWLTVCQLFKISWVFAGDRRLRDRYNLAPGAAVATATSFASSGWLKLFGSGGGLVFFFLFFFSAAIRCLI